MPVRATPQQATAKWLQGMSNSAERATSGANAVTIAPGMKAAAAKQKWLARVTASADKYARNVSAVTLDQWRQAYLKYGVNNMVTGAQNKQGKVLAFQTDFQNYLKAGIGTIDAMPSNTLQDGIARAVAMINYNAKYVRGASSGQ